MVAVPAWKDSERTVLTTSPKTSVSPARPARFTATCLRRSSGLPFARTYRTGRKAREAGFSFHCGRARLLPRFPGRGGGGRRCDWRKASIFLRAPHVKKWTSQSHGAVVATKFTAGSQNAIIDRVGAATRLLRFNHRGIAELGMIHRLGMFQTLAILRAHRCDDWFDEWQQHFACLCANLAPEIGIGTAQ